MMASNEWNPWNVSGAMVKETNVSWDGHTTTTEITLTVPQGQQHSWNYNNTTWGPTPKDVEARKILDEIDFPASTSAGSEEVLNFLKDEEKISKALRILKMGAFK